MKLTEPANFYLLPGAGSEARLKSTHKIELVRRNPNESAHYRDLFALCQRPFHVVRRIGIREGMAAASTAI